MADLLVAGSRSSRLLGDCAANHVPSFAASAELISGKRRSHVGARRSRGLPRLARRLQGLRSALQPRRCEDRISESPSDTNREGEQMNWDRIEGNWKQFVGKARQKWADLTDDDLDKVHGKKDELVGKIQERKGIAREEAEREVDEWSKSL
jgi:uncharacterized protein YjbJ (UPF0337 family)